jgi:hypothetical protein
MAEKYEGFIVHAYFPKDKRSSRLYLVGRLRNGETFAVVEERERPPSRNPPKDFSRRTV